MFKDIRQVVKDSILYGMGNIAVKLVGFVLIPLYTDEKYFSPADYGLMGLLEVTSQIIIAVMGLSLFSGLIRWYWDDEYKDRQKSIFFTTLLFTFATSIFVGGLLWFNVDGLSALILYGEEYTMASRVPYILQLLILYSILAALIELPQNLLRLKSKPLFYSLSLIQIDYIFIPPSIWIT